jgi:hypothetical protein
MNFNRDVLFPPITDPIEDPPNVPESRGAPNGRSAPIGKMKKRKKSDHFQLDFPIGALLKDRK